MPTNENTYNSRVTSEALEAKFRQVFPSQGGAELVDDLYASGVIQPVIDFSSVAEGSVLPVNLQTAWDFSTGHVTRTGAGTSTMITNTGFWRIQANVGLLSDSGSPSAFIFIDTGLGTKIIWQANLPGVNAVAASSEADDFVVYLRAGDSLKATSTSNASLNVNWRQIADVNGNLVNPLGFTFS